MSDPFLSQRSPAPGGLPSLSEGSHLGPEAGACFMEYVSLLAGEPWSDQPKCTHPLLAEVGRVVNDSLTQAGRNRLVPLLPVVIGRTSDDPRVGPALVDRLVTTAESYGVEAGRTLRWHQHSARRRLARLAGRNDERGRAGRVRGLADLAYQEGPAVRAIDAVGRAVGRLPAPARDDALLALLRAAIDVLTPNPPSAADRARISQSGG